MSAKIKLDKDSIPNLPLPEGGRPNAVYFDTEQKGFGIRVSKGGKRSFFVNYYNAAGKERRVTIGEWGKAPKLTAKAARSQAEKIRANAKDADPLAKKAISRTTPTVDELVNEYMAKWAEGNLKSFNQNTKPLLTKYIIGRWQVKADKLTGRDVVLLLDEIRGRGKMVQANRVLGVLRRVYNWGIEQYIVDANPTARIKATKETSRDRVLSLSEIKTVWEVLGKKHQHVLESTNVALRLILITGQRPGEVAAMRWTDIEDGWWTITDTKNGSTHRAPLSPLALSLIEPMRGNKQGEYVFPTPRGKGHIEAHALSRASRRIDWGIEHFTPHDLRRTMATNLGRIGFNRLVQDKILNHKDNSVGGIYDRYTYDDEKMDAVCRWADEIQRIVEGETTKVVSINKASA